MEQNEQFSMHKLAKKNTEEALSYLIVQLHSKSLELNELGNTLLKHARMELYVAQNEGVPTDELSATAQELLKNPNLSVDIHFAERVYSIMEPNPQNCDGVQAGIFVEVTEQPTTDTTAEIITDDFCDVESDDHNGGNEYVDIIKVNPKLNPVVKGFDKLYPAYSGDIANKIYKTSVLKPARELVKSLIDDETQFALNRLTQHVRAEAICEVADEHSELTKIFEHYSKISAIYDAVIKGALIADFEFDDLKDEANKVAELDSLAYTIVSNAQQFKDDNAKILSGKNLTAGNIKQYYSALGKSESTKQEKISGQEVIRNEIASDVASIMAKQ